MDKTLARKSFEEMEKAIRLAKQPLIFGATTASNGLCPIAVVKAFDWDCVLSTGFISGFLFVWDCEKQLEIKNRVQSGVTDYAIGTQVAASLWKKYPAERAD